MCLPLVMFLPPPIPLYLCTSQCAEYLRTKKAEKVGIWENSDSKIQANLKTVNPEHPEQEGVEMKAAPGE